MSRQLCGQKLATTFWTDHAQCDATIRVREFNRKIKSWAAAPLVRHETRYALEIAGLEMERVSRVEVGDAGDLRS